MTNNEKEEIEIALVNYYGYKKAQYYLNLINKPVETTNEQPKTNEWCTCDNRQWNGDYTSPTCKNCEGIFD